MNRNFERMIALADLVFATKNDPNQLDVNEEVIEQLQLLHPASVCEEANDDGPIAWVLLIPTTQKLALAFINEELSETELLSQTPSDQPFEVIYLCSALVLEEFRKQGIVKRLTLDAVNAIRANHPIKSLVVWPFTDEGWHSAERIAQACELPLIVRKHH
jgi:ribosomal protein S18 acetylase RimI-like enzyme